MDKTVLRRGGFTFKRFFVAHDRCAMKVGTDSVLLGAWAPFAGSDPILDIGCGSGVIALMLAQRCGGHRQVDAVELDVAAAEQARENVAASPWQTGVRVVHQDIHEFAVTSATRYGLIVSNPPYFQPAVACRDRARDVARYTETLTHQGLLHCAEQLLLPDGLFCVVLPVEAGELLIQQALSEGWHLRQQVVIADRATRPVQRLLLAFSRQPGELQQENLYLREPDGRYSAGFIQLTLDFYLFLD